jgi:hypothetical protein
VGGVLLGEFHAEDGVGVAADDDDARMASALSTLHDEFDAAVEEADGLLVDLPEAERLQRRVALHAAGAASAVVDSEDEAVVRRPKVAGVSAAAVDRP